MKVSSAQPVRACASSLAGLPHAPRLTYHMAVRVGILFVAVAAIGCRNDGSQRDAYIRELRMHEDQIYELQDYMTEYQELLRRQRRENSRLREQLAMESTSVPTAESTDDEEDDFEERSLLDRPAAAESGSAEETELPEIDLGEPALPEIDHGEPSLPEEAEQIPAGDLGETSFAPPGPAARQVSAEIDATDLEEEAVFATPPMPLQKADSCAIYAEQTPIETIGDEPATGTGLMVIVEPLTAEGGAGAFIGELSLMLLDPIADEDNQEIARWDFTPEEVEAAWRDVSRRVLDLPIATPIAAPVGRPLELWVRLIPAERDRKILTHTGIELVDPVRLIGVPVSGGASSTVPGSRVSSGWTAADALRAQESNETRSRSASWEPAKMLPPAAVARAEAIPTESDNRTPEEWSPLR
ncbi:MAG: hypothetical protein ACR2NU_05725 [Aeoliella sp.]